MSFGNAPPPPPPTDPNGAYPANLTTAPLQAPMANQYVEGFIYTVVNGTFDGSRLQFGVVAEQVFQAYCAIQPQTWGYGPNGTAPYECLPNWGFSCGIQTCTSTNPNDSSQTITYATVKQSLCGTPGVCVCTATSCAAPTIVDITFDMMCSGSLDGSIAGALGDHNIHLKKQ
jgi:hypothetical protein